MHFDVVLRVGLVLEEAVLYDVYCLLIDIHL